jgi:hypothetical protein
MQSQQRPTGVPALRSGGRVMALRARHLLASITYVMFPDLPFRFNLEFQTCA